MGEIRTRFKGTSENASVASGVDIPRCLLCKKFASNPELPKATLQDVRQKLLAAGATNHAGQGVDYHVGFVSYDVFLGTLW